VRRLVVDAVVAALFTVAVDGYYLWISPPWNSFYPSSSTVAQLVMLSPLSLVLLRRRPEVPAVVLTGASILATPVGEPLPVLACAALAMFFLGLGRPRRQAALSALVVLAVPPARHLVSFQPFDYLNAELPPVWTSTLLVCAGLAVSAAAGGFVRSRGWTPAALGNQLLRLLDDPVFRTWVDGVVAAGLVVLVVRELQNDPIGGDWSDAQQWVLLLAAAAPASLAVRRKIPEIPLLVLAATCLLVYPLAQTQWVLITAFALALYSIGVHRTWWKSALYAGTTLVALRVISWLLHDGPSARLVVDGLYYAVGDRRMAELLQRIWPVWLSASLALAWAIGLLTRLALQNRRAAQREAALVQKTQEQEQLQVLLEGRSQIARDLHDVVAHAVNLMVIQAETGPDLIARGDQDVLAGFQRIGDAGRRALGELDRMLSALRDADGVPDPALTPQPGLSDLRRLVKDVAHDGLTVELDVQGETELAPTGHQLAAYRLVQEALTNAVRHAEATEVVVTLEVQAGELRVEVSDNGHGFDPEVARTGGRHGLAGMRERVRIHHGTLAIDAAPGRGTTVAARIPLTAEVSR
jgi:signal transduction histidine kinase